MIITPFNEATAGETLRVFSVYADFEASRHAKYVTGAIIKLAGHPGQFVTEMWKLDVLTANETIKRMFMRDAARADVLIVSVSSLAQRPGELIALLDAVTTVKPASGLPGLLIGLLGSEENLSHELDWTVKRLIGCAQRANRDFIWHWMGPEALNDFDWLTENVGMLMRRKCVQREQTSLKEAAVA